MPDTTIAQSPANAPLTRSHFWLASVMIVYTENGQQVSWICNVIQPTKQGYVNVQTLLAIQAKAQEHFIKALPSQSLDNITNVVVMNVNLLGHMLDTEYMNTDVRELLDDQLKAAQEKANGSN